MHNTYFIIVDDIIEPAKRYLQLSTPYTYNQCDGKGDTSWSKSKWPLRMV